VRVAGLAVAVAACAIAPVTASAARPAPSRDWSRAVALTPEGGFRMGNPAARVKLVEYGSLACPHCRHFKETGYDPLVKNYVRTGRVSYEFRNMVLNGPDISVSLLTRCAGAAGFFPMSAVVYATQPQWEKKVMGVSEADKSALDAMSDDQRIVRYAANSGLVPVAARFGVTPARARQCLTDGKALKRLLDMTQAANDKGVDHTPTFIIDGNVTDAATWEQLEPKLKTALSG
jgi:protein-disulfide isomerase